MTCVKNDMKRFLPLLWGGKVLRGGDHGMNPSVADDLTEVYWKECWKLSVGLKWEHSRLTVAEDARKRVRALFLTYSFLNRSWSQIWLCRNCQFCPSSKKKISQERNYPFIVVTIYNSKLIVVQYFFANTSSMVKSTAAKKVLLKFHDKVYRLYKEDDLDSLTSFEK